MSVEGWHQCCGVAYEAVEWPIRQVGVCLDDVGERGGDAEGMWVPLANDVDPE